MALDQPDGSLRTVEAGLICGLTMAGSSWDIESIRDDMNEVVAAFLALVDPVL